MKITHQKRGQKSNRLILEIIFLKMFGNFMNFGGGSQPGDSDYPKYNLPPFLASERMFNSMSGEVSPSKERAFTIANKATCALEQHDFKTAEKMGVHAVTIDPECVDGWRILCRCINQVGDGDTVITATREVLNFARTTEEVKECLESEPGMFYSMHTTRNYMRILTDMGSTALQSEQLDVSLMTYEEMIRLNHNDNTGARDPLLACYIKLLGRINSFPNTKPVRTFEQVDAFINLKWNGEGIFEDDNLSVRWYNMIKAYAKKQNWKELAKAEYKKNDLMFKVAFNELDVNEIPAESPYGFMVGSKSDDVRARGYMLKEALRDWPSFLLDCYKLLRNKLPVDFVSYVKGQTPDPENELTPEYKMGMHAIAENFLESGRKALRGHDFLGTIKNCTLAKRGYFEGSQPSRRWYLHAPFAIASNRATAATALSMWNLARIDTRFTLQMKPDHERSYYRLVKIAEAFSAKQLIPVFKKMGEDVKENPPKTEEEWKELAKVAIGLLSIPAIVLAAKNKLTEAERQRLINVGIDDMYTTVNFPADVTPVLPYLKETDLEAPIPNM